MINVTADRPVGQAGRRHYCPGTLMRMMADYRHVNHRLQQQQQQQQPEQPSVTHGTKRYVSARIYSCDAILLQISWRSKDL